jgi:hypothetical protein
LQLRWDLPRRRSLLYAHPVCRSASTHRLMAQSSVRFLEVPPVLQSLFEVITVDVPVGVRGMLVEPFVFRFCFGKRIV